MNRSLETLVALTGKELSSEKNALEAIDAANAIEPVPPVADIRPYLPEKGTSIGPHLVLARAQLESGETDDADQTLIGVAERLNQAGYWQALGRVVGMFLDRRPQQAAPLIARARANGGESAVDNDLLFTARQSLPGHGLLAWLAAEAHMADGDDVAARRTAAGALPELIAEKNFDTAELALLLLAEDEGTDTVDAICRSLELLANQEAWEQFDMVLDLTGDLLASEPAAESSWPVIRELWRRHPQYGPLRSTAAGVARAHFARFPEPESMIRISEIERPSHSPEVVLERLRRAERFPPGYYAMHAGWGIGRIRDNDTEHLTIDFPGKPGHRMTMNTAEQALDTLSPDDLRVLLVHDPDEVDRLRREDPASLLVKALLSLKGARGTGDDLRKTLVPAVVTTAAWSGWWKAAKAAAASDPRIDGREAYKNVFRLARAGDTQTAVPLPVWEKAKGTLKNLALLDTFLALHPEERDRLFDAVRETVESAFHDREANLEAAAAAGLWLLRLDPGREEGPESFVGAGFDFNALDKKDQEQLLDRVSSPDSLLAALNSRLVSIRRRAGAELESQGNLAKVSARALAEAASYPEAALHALETLTPATDDTVDGSLCLLALLDLLESPPRESHRNRAFSLLQPGSSLAQRLNQSRLSEASRDRVADRLQHWQSSDRYRFPVLDFLRANGLEDISDRVEGVRASKAARVTSNMTAEDDFPEDVTFLTRPTMQRLREERHRVGMELKTTIPRAIQKARELGDLRENAEYAAAKAKQAAYANRFEDLERLLNRVQLIEDLPRADGVAAPGTEVELESRRGERLTVWLLGEGDQEIGDGVVSYKAAVGRAIRGRRVGDEVMLPQETGDVAYRVIQVRERLP